MSEKFYTFFRFFPQFVVLNYSQGKEIREEQRANVISDILSQEKGWNKARFPFHVMLAHYEVWISSGCSYKFEACLVNKSM